MIAPFAPHSKAHAVPREPSALAQFFRRAASVRRKPAAPAAPDSAGTATQLLTAPAASPAERLAGVREQWNAWHDGQADAGTAAMRPRKRLPRADGEIVIDQHGVHVRPVNGRYLGTQPRRQPVYGEVPVASVLAAERDAARAAGERAALRYEPPSIALLRQVRAGLRRLA